MSAWQPIKTAPKDGSTIIIYHPRIECVYTTWWDERVRMWSGVEYGSIDPGPSHWMPLPEPPK